MLHVDNNGKKTTSDFLDTVVLIGVQKNKAATFVSSWGSGLKKNKMFIYHGGFGTWP